MQANNITIKDSTGADILYTLISPAAGFGPSAVWYHKNGISQVLFPKLMAASERRNGQKMTRATIRIEDPTGYTDAVTGLSVATVTPLAKLEVFMPDAYPEDMKDQWVNRVVELVKSDQVKAIIRDALPAT